MSQVAELEAESSQLFARRMVRGEQVVILLRGLRRDLNNSLIAERQQKSAIYLANMNVSHGERQGIANAETAQIGTEILQLKGQIEVLEEELAWIKFCVEWDVGE